MSLSKPDPQLVKDLNSHACQTAVERAYSSIARFYSNCKKQIPGKKGYPKFKKNCRSVEYKTSGWKLSETRKQITFTDKKGIGKGTVVPDVPPERLERRGCVLTATAVATNSKLLLYPCCFLLHRRLNVCHNLLHLTH